MLQGIALANLQLLYLGLLGFFIIVNSRLHSNYKIFFAPAYGLAVVVLQIFFVSRLGISLKIGSALIFLINLIYILFRFKKYKHVIKQNISKNKFYILITLIFSFTYSWPLVKFGTRWISYGNDDMANYTLAAKRFYNYGFFDSLNKYDLGSGLDYSQAYFSMHVTHGARPGSELLLSFASRLLAGDTLRIFMPTILMLLVSLIFLLIGVIFSNTKNIEDISKVSKSLVIIFTSISPLLILGYLYQLIGQIGGLIFSIMLIEIAIKTLGPLLNSKQKLIWRNLFFLVLVSSALLIWYPEIIPFTALPILISLSLLAKKSKSFNRLFSLFAALILFVALTLGTYFIKSINYLLNQAQVSSAAADYVKTNGSYVILFPYYLIAHGFSALFGFAPIQEIYFEPLESILIFFGICSLIYLIFLALRRARRYDVYAYSLIVYLISAFFLAKKSSDFGLFKLAMFVTPTILILISIIYLESTNKNPYNLRFGNIRRVVLVISIPVIFITQQIYVSASTGTRSGGFVELPNASANNLIGQLDNIRNRYNEKQGTIISDTSNVVVAKIEMNRFIGVPILFPSSNFISNITNNSNYGSNSPNNRRIINFPSNPKNQFRVLNLNSSELNKSWILTTGGSDSILNRRGPSYSRPNAKLVSSPTNHLIFVSSKLGPAAYYSSERKKTSFYQLELDPMAPKTQMSSLGRIMLLEVVNFKPNSKLRFDLTSTVLPQQDHKIPFIKIIGKKEYFIDSPGFGSARITSGPIEPLLINGRAFFQIEFGNNPKPFPYSPVGLNSLFNKDITFDSRNIATFGKAIRLIKSQESEELQNTAISIFPDDLIYSELDYAGWYEDGWIADKSWVELKVSRVEKQHLLVKGMVPGSSSYETQKLTLKIGENYLKTFILKPGNFELRIPFINVNQSNVVRVDFDWKNSIRLTQPDGRLVTAKIQLVKTYN